MGQHHKYWWKVHITLWLFVEAYFGVLDFLYSVLDGTCFNNGFAVSHLAQFNVAIIKAAFEEFKIEELKAITPANYTGI